MPVTVPPNHLTPEDVLQVVDFMADCDPIIVGGQSVNIWAEFYGGRDPSLDEMGPFTSKDVDFFRNKKAAEKLASELQDGTILLPTASDFATPSAAVVLGTLNGKRIQIDFMRAVLGVDDESIMENFVGIEGEYAGRSLSLLVMHPLDCVKSRLANINRLGRHEDHSVRQACASIKILGHYIDDLIEAGNTRSAQRVLATLQFVVRDQHLGKASHIRFGGTLCPLDLMDRFRNDDRLDPRWRELILSRAVARLRSTADRLQAIAKARAESALDDPTEDRSTGMSPVR